MKNNKLKSLITMFLTIALVCTSIPLSMAFAAAEPTITVEQTQVSSSANTASVKLSINNNTGFISMNLTVEYDKNAMTLKNVADSGLISGKTHSSNYSAYPYTLSWQNPTVESNITANGVIVTLEFELNSGLKPGDYEVKVSYDADNYEVIDYDMNPVVFKIENGGVKVVCDHDYTDASAIYIDGEHHGIRCNKCGEVKADSVKKHEGGKATCAAKAICSVCHAEYGNFGKHQYAETVDDEFLKSAATCTSKAVYWKSCSVCKRTPQDDDTVTEKTFEYGDTLPHNPSTEWDSDVSGHWKKCTLGCGIMVDGSGVETAPIPHTYDGEVVDERYLKSEADCKNDAVYWKSCSVCGFSAANEITKPESDRTFTDEGSKKPHEYEEYTPDNTSPETYLKSNKTCQNRATYYKRCKYCKEKGTETFEYGELGEHNYVANFTDSKYIKTPANCKDPAVYYMPCSVCGATSETKTIVFGGIDPNAHEYVMTDLGDGTHGEKCTRCPSVKTNSVEVHKGGEATCKEKAKCKVCDAEYGDYAAHNYINKAEEKYLKSAATCVSRAVYYKSCSVCGLSAKDDDTVTDKTFEDGDLAPHTPSSNWSYDDNGHWKDCTNTVGCGVKLNGDGKVIENPIAHSGGKATCKEKKKCDVCGAEYGEPDKNNHVNVELVNAKAATEETEGYTGDKVCKDCGKPVESGKTIAKLVHDPKKVEAKSATAASEGNKEYWYCENCGKYYLDSEFETEVTRDDVVIAKLKPAIVDKEKQNFKKGSANSVGFNSSAAYEDFSGVKVDGKDIDSSNYDVVKNEDGTLRVVLKTAYLDTLGAGNHTVSIVSVSGSADTEFTVSAADKVVVPGEGTSPKTGDFNNIFFWAVMALAAVFGVFTAVYVRKKVVNR